LNPGTESRPGIEPAARNRKASSIARSRDQNLAEQQIIVDCLRRMVQSWYSRGDFERLECVELLFALGWTNKAVALQLGITEQAVANHKSFIIGKLKEAAQHRGLDWNSMGLASS
jgi:RNA polymerase sigma-70 factor (ECF subfamily)